MRSLNDAPTASSPRRGMVGAREATLVTGGFFYVRYSACWSPGESTDPGSPLHGAYLAATTMTFARITACRVGTAIAARTCRASLSEIGIFSNSLLLWGILFELAFAAAVIYLPPLQAVFGTNALDVRELAILALSHPGVGHRRAQALGQEKSKGVRV